MKNLFVAVSLLTIASLSASATVRPLNWVHKGKKTAPPSCGKVEYHGTTAYTAEGRLYFATPGHDAPALHSKKSNRVK
jgi:hypothetical protein